MTVPQAESNFRLGRFSGSGDRVVEDGNLVTGQQNNSSGAAASVIVEKIKASR